jgi:hypothetical protein
MFSFIYYSFIFMLLAAAVVAMLPFILLLLAIYAIGTLAVLFL